MKSRLSLFVIIFGIPIFAFAVANGIHAHFNSELRKAIHQQYPNGDSKKIANFTIDYLCNEQDLASNDLADLCSTNANLIFMSNAAIYSAGVGLILLLAIYIGGTVARNNRRLLLLLFRPGLYVTAFVLTILILIYAALAIAAIYYGESALIGRIHLKIIALIGIGALMGVTVLVRNAFSLIKKAEVFVLGMSLSHDEAPKLWSTIEQLSDKLGALRPQNIIVGLDPNFFVTEANIRCLSGSLSGRNLYCSLPLCRILGKDEFCSVIGHELGHFKGLDTKYSESFYPIYRGTASSIAALGEAGGEGLGQLALLPAIAILSYFIDCFAVAENRISRKRELAADQEGASVAGPHALANALVKVHAFSGAWQGFDKVAEDALQNGKMFLNASKLFAEAVADIDRQKALEGILETNTPHPTDSHPPLGTRLESLKVSLEEISPTALDVSPADPAFSLIESTEKKEEEISAAYQMLLAKRLGISLDETGEEKPQDQLPSKTICPHCEAEYDPNDYNQDLPEWLCSACGKALPRG